MKELIFKLSGREKLEMVLISAGAFWMGSPENETGRKMRDERLHQVTLTRDFYLGKYPVTQAQYEAVMGCNPSAFRTGGKHPVECVSWFEAMAFCERITKELKPLLPDGFQFCLPTEAQWEYACRAGQRTALYNGMELERPEGRCQSLEPIAWYVENHSADGHLPVGGKEPNAFGLYDMLGNIHEWVYDRYGPYEAEAVDPTGPAAGPERVVRGGSWRSPAWRCRAARRGVDAPEYRLNGLGFRAALVFRENDAFAKGR